ncbi:MAG: hypothetical protein PHO32_00565, partial [Candidatus Cloacimonetes bacterium]|nr:hypothetical protein [Candidatus Cloacimonadota bacterium]
MLRWIAALIFSCIFATLVAQQSLVRSFLSNDGILMGEFENINIPVEQRDPGPSVTPTRSAVLIADIPAYDWSYGCGATSAAMMAAYWDRHGYNNIYTGSTNGGVMPLSNSAWGGGECPLSATHTGID